MPATCNILMIRHAEKPVDGPGLSNAGVKRAQAYVDYFRHYSINGAGLKLNYLFCAADSAESSRPRLTIEPTAAALQLKMNDKHVDKDFQQVADHIMSNPKYNNSSILICWHHETILNFAAAIGADTNHLPATAAWPAIWPGDEYGWLLQICFDSNGHINVQQTKRVVEPLNL